MLLGPLGKKRLEEKLSAVDFFEDKYKGTGILPRMRRWCTTYQLKRGWYGVRGQNLVDDLFTDDEPEENFDRYSSYQPPEKRGLQ